MLVLWKKLLELALTMLCCGRKKGRLEQMSQPGTRPGTLKDKHTLKPGARVEKVEKAPSGRGGPVPAGSRPVSSATAAATTTITAGAGGAGGQKGKTRDVQTRDQSQTLKARTAAVDKGNRGRSQQQAASIGDGSHVKCSGKEQGQETIVDGKVVKTQGSGQAHKQAAPRIRAKVDGADSNEHRSSPHRGITQQQHQQHHHHQRQQQQQWQQQQQQHKQQQQKQQQQQLQQIQQQQHHQQQQHQQQHNRHNRHPNPQHNAGRRTNNSSTLEMGIKNMEQVDEDTMIQTVEILKRPGQSLGFYIREGNGLDRSDGVFISRIASGSVVENNGLLRVADEIVTVNSVDVSKMSLDDVVILMSIPKRLVLTIRTRKSCCKNASCPSLSTLEQEEEPPPVVVVKKGRSSSATAVEMTEKCPDEFTLSRQEERAYYAKYGSYPVHPQHPGSRARFYGGEVDESPYARINDLQHYLPQHPGAREMSESSHHDFMGEYIRDRRSPKMGIKEPPPAISYRSPRAIRRHAPPYQLDYSSDSDARYYYDGGPNESPYSAPRLPPRTYDPQAVKAFQDEIERSHHRYESMISPRVRLGKSQRSLSPERYNSDSEVHTVYRGRDHPDRTYPGRDCLISHLTDSEERCNSLPHMDPGESSEELKHWLKKFDNLSVELQGQGHQEPSKTQTGVSMAEPVPYTPRPGLAVIPGPAGSMQTPALGDRESFTSEEYWSWTQKHNSPPTTMQKPETTFPRTSRGPRPRVTRKLSADSLLDYRTYQMEDTPDQGPDQGRSGRRGPRSASSHPHPPGGGSGNTHPLVKTRQASMDIENRLPHSPSSRIKDLQLGRKPLQIRPDDFRLYQPEMEERKPKIEQNVEGLLRVQLYCGHGLKSSRTMLRDLYTVIEVDSLNKARTMIRTGAINFDWDEAFDIELENAQEMSFLVYSWDPNTRHRLCFSGTVALPNLLQYGSYQKIALKLEPKGILYLELEYQEPAISLQRTPSIRKNALFGVDLETIIRREKSGHNVPLLVKNCIEEVERRGLDHVGIYRLCGSAKRKAQLKEEFERSTKSVDLSADAVSDINVITGVLKDFLRELPEPLFTNALYQMLLDALSVRLPGDPDGSAKLMLSILECLPKANQETMACVLDHLKHVAIKVDINKMTTQNLAVCFGPVLLCPSPQSVVDADQALDFKRHIDVLRYLLDIWPSDRDSSLPLKIANLSVEPNGSLVAPHIVLPPSDKIQQQAGEQTSPRNKMGSPATSGGKTNNQSGPNGQGWDKEEVSSC